VEVLKIIIESSLEEELLEQLQAAWYRRSALYPPPVVIPFIK
jgi:hypothetical protein